MRFVRRTTATPITVEPEAVRECLCSFPVSLAVLFGSRATGTENALSDLDIAVRFDNTVSSEEKPHLFDTLIAEIIETTGVDAIDLVDLELVGADLGYEILTQGTLLLGDRTTVVKLESTFLSKKLDFKPVKDEWQAALSDRLSEGEYGRA